MKKSPFLLLFILVCFIGKAQTTSVERSIWGVQTGFLGMWLHSETKMADKLALRAEFGFDSGIWTNLYDDAGFVMAPVITVEPRWYYNLSKREGKSKQTSGNSGNFISLKTSYHPDWFVISNYNNVSVITDISVVPTWGIRRNIGNHFNFETGIGLGYQYTFAKQSGYDKDESKAIFNLHLRVGYRF